MGEARRRPYTKEASRMPDLPRRPLLAALAFGWVSTAIAQPQGAERAAWSDAAFAAAQAAGRPLIVEVTAPW